MASYNRVMLIGNVTRDPELRYVPSGMAVTDLGLAVNDRRKGANGEWIEETTFVEVTLWGRTAEVACEYLSKGAPAFIEGRLKLDTWEKDGKKNSKLKVVGEKLQLIGAKGGGGSGGGNRGGGATRSAPPQHDESEANFGGGGGDYYDEGPTASAAPNRSAGGGGAAPKNDDIPF